MRRPADAAVARNGQKALAQALHLGTVEVVMKRVVLDLPVLGFVVTRAALAAGIALLVSEKLSTARRRALGLTLLAIGVTTTLPAAISVVRGSRRARSGSVLRSDQLGRPGDHPLASGPI